MVHPVQSVVESLYAAGRCPRLHVNALCEGVVCPDFIREQWQERLIIDLDASYPLDLTFADDGIGADLSFGGYVTRCTFPWKAIYVVADRATGRGIVLDQNMPESVRRSRHQPITGPLATPTELRGQPGASSSSGAGPSRSSEGARLQPSARPQPTPTPTSTSAPQGSVGPSGPKGSVGPSGPKGSVGPSGPTGSAPRRVAGVTSTSEGEQDQEAKRRRAAFKVIDGGG